jgi:hypothetical protein
MLLRADLEYGSAFFTTPSRLLGRSRVSVSGDPHPPRRRSHVLFQDIWQELAHLGVGLDCVSRVTRNKHVAGGVIKISDRPNNSLKRTGDDGELTNEGL